MQDLPPILDEQLADAQARNSDPSYMQIHNLSELPVLDYRTVKALQGNLKDLSAKNHDKLLKVLKKRGFTTPLFVWQEPETSELYLLDGHQRQRVMVKNHLNDDGNYNVPYALIPGDNLQAAKEQLLEITSQYGTMTMDGLDEFAFDIDVGSLDVNFDALDLDKYLDNLVDEDEADDEAPEVDDVNPPVSVLGQVYQLGAHRLMCGDSTSLEAVEQLMDGVKADMVFTDPPYNIDYEGVSKGKFEKIKNDKMSDEDFVEFLKSSLSSDAETYYVCCSWQYSHLFRQAMEAIGKPVKSFIVWNKVNPAQHLDKYFKQHEIILYSGKFGGEATIRGDVWETKRELNTLHPTMKPVSLITMALKDNPTKHLIYDAFLGSGSTLIAAEVLSRTCYGMELDERYCDVIRKRYAKHIGSEDWEAVTPAIVYETA